MKQKDDDGATPVDLAQVEGLGFRVQAQGVFCVDTYSPAVFLAKVELFCSTTFYLYTQGMC